MEKNNVLVIGSGGREHVLSWKLAQSDLVQEVYVAPGNAGTYKTGKVDNVALDLKDFGEVVKFCREKSISLVVVGPEDPLARGIADRLSAEGILCCGPSAAASQIEASKEFAKEFMVRHNIPTARYKSFTDAEFACSHIQQADYAALVVKASGLAGGKGVIVAMDKAEACQAVNSMLMEKTFGSAGNTVIVEELLEGEEVSVLAFSDGHTVAVMPPAQDHKTLNEGDCGPNTGGMGVICPYSKLTEKEMEFIKQDILQKTIDGMRSEGVPYKGVLYAGLMLTSAGPKVLEFNCRFGDPEAQGILSLLRSDLYLTCKACVDGTLSDHRPVFDQQSCSVGIVVVSGGYPGSYKKGLPISGLQDVEKAGHRVYHAGTSWNGDQLVTSGGRVLCVVSTAKDCHQACSQACNGAALVTFQDSYYRKDIGFKLLARAGSGDGLTYRDSGVDIDAGNSLVDSIKPLAAATRRPGCSEGIGGFGAMFDLKAAGYTDPILVSGTDGVGTKLKIAQSLGKHNTIGTDLVAMCVNDILAQGAEPLFFLDYFATGKLSVVVAKEVIDGIAAGCKIAGCALVGGETAEMPGMYSGSDYDLAGFAVGAMERGHALPRLQEIQAGDVVIGLKSSGIHSNGFSLVRKVIEKLNLNLEVPSPLKTGKTLGDDLLTPTRIYVKELLPLIKGRKVKAVAHITGGGLIENIPRILPENLGVTVDALKWDIPSVFGWLADKGNISDKEMLRTYNCGIGAVVIVESSVAGDVSSSLGDSACVIGQVVQKSGPESVDVRHLCPALMKSWQRVPGVMRRKKVGVLISGSGTNLQALIDHTTESNNNSCAELSLVISNKPNVQGLTRAQAASIPTMVINHKDYKSREDFDLALHQALTDAGVEIVCLAGFMRILTGDFVNKWTGRMLNIHPSLLPSFKGHDAHKQVLQANVRISGCTVHFVAEEVDGGAILVQESVPVYPGDTEESLSERIKKVEHRAFPRALELVASEQAVLRKDGIIEWCQ